MGTELSFGEVHPDDRALWGQLAPHLARHVSEAELERAAIVGLRAGVRLLRALEGSGLVDLDDLRAAAVVAAGYPVVAVQPSMVPAGVWDALDIEVCIDFASVPIAWDPEERTVTMAMVDPTNAGTIRDLARQLQLDPNDLTPIAGTGVKVTLNSIHQSQDAHRALERSEAARPEITVVEDDESSDGPFASLVTSMLTDAQAQGAVDIHLEPVGYGRYDVQYRIDGIIVTIKELSARDGERYVRRIQQMGKMDSSPNRPADGSASIAAGYGGGSLDLRIATAPTAWGHPKAVVRLLVNRPELLDLDNLYDRRDVERWIEAVSVPTGLHIVVGKTGDGKPVAADTPVLCADGALRPIGDLEVGDEVISHTGRPRTITNTWDQGQLPVWRITTASGRTVRAAGDHPFLVRRNGQLIWATTADLVVGDAAVVVQRSRAPSTDLATRHFSSGPGDLEVEWATPEHRSKLLAHAASLGAPARVVDNRVVIADTDRAAITNAYTSREPVGLADDPIVELEADGQTRCCCIEVDVDHTYVVDGIVCHNSTTVAATLSRLLHTPPLRKIITIEDPIEIRVPGLSQLPVNPANAQMGFAGILKSVLRQDPDLVNIGEIRDKESGEIGIQAAETGHGVFATLHTRSTAGAAARLAALGVNRIQIADTLRSVLSQRLVRALCQTCREPVRVTDQMLSDWAWPHEAEPAAPTEVFEANPAGCSSCRGGYKGRFAVPEILVVTRPVAELIADGALAADIRKAAIADGMTPLWERGLGFVAAGMTSVDELSRHIDR